MTAGKLKDLKLARLIWKVAPQIGFECGQIELFAGPNGCGMVQQVAHWKSFLTIRDHRRIVDVPLEIETAECKPLRSKKKFAPGSIPGHPTYAQGILWRELQGALHHHRDGATRSKNRDAFASSAGGKKSCEPGTYSGTKLPPGLHSIRWPTRRQKVVKSCRP